MNKNNAIIGTAGHVDHGKTLLIHALTGIETDRLAEEKKRGITIELGFAHMVLPNGEKAGIIDVPGHEKFVRNMLSGAGSIDLAMLVVAADEGIMPQTREHLAILNLLDIPMGLVVLNKIDLVDEDWLAMVTLDIEEEFAGTFLENAPIIPVSAYNGSGIEALRLEIFAMLDKSPAKKIQRLFRLPIDRVFTMDGFGTVVTGTLIEGSLNLGQDVAIFPSNLVAKARRLQVHGELVEQAFAGQRVAVNLAGLKISDISKGDVAAAPGSMENSRILDIVLEINKDCQREIRHNSRLHLHHGTRDVLCTLVLLEQDVIKSGERAYGQLRLAEPLAAKPGDRFVLRFYSPTETIGGGKILDSQARRVKRHDVLAANRLAIKEKGSLRERVEIVFEEAGLAFEFRSGEYMRQTYFYDEVDFDTVLAGLIEDNKLMAANGSILHISFLNELGQRAQLILNRHHKTNPLQEGMTLQEFYSRLLPRQTGQAESVAALLAKFGFIRLGGNVAAHSEFKPTATQTHDKIRDKVLETYLKAGFITPTYDDVASDFVKEKRAYAQTFEALVKNGDLVMLAPQTYMHRANFDKAFEVFAGLAEGGKVVTLGDFRDAISASRKYALAILEYFDKKGITKKVGDGRILK